MNREELCALLARHPEIPLATWGTGSAKTFDHLLKEIERKESFLTEEDGALVRHAWPVMVRVTYTDSVTSLALPRVLVEAERWFVGGRGGRRSLPASLAEKATRGEDVRAAAIRALAEELKVTVAEPTSLTRVLVQRRVTKDSWSFPGTVSDFEETHFEFSMPSDQYQDEYREEQEDKTTIFRWIPWDERPWKYLE